MSIYKSWGYRDIGASLDTVYVTGGQEIIPIPGLIYFIVATHSGVGSGAKIELGEGQSTTKLHLESSSGDVSPFGISLSKPISFETSIQLSATATGLKCTVGYHGVPT